MQRQKKYQVYPVGQKSTKKVIMTGYMFKCANSAEEGSSKMSTRIYGIWEEGKIPADQRPLGISSYTNDSSN
jgi:hypothetical protein